MLARVNAIADTDPNTYANENAAFGNVEIMLIQLLTV